MLRENPYAMTTEVQPEYNNRSAAVASTVKPEKHPKVTCEDEMYAVNQKKGFSNRSQTNGIYDLEYILTRNSSQTSTSNSK